MPEVYMNARRVEQEKVHVPGDVKKKLLPVIYESGYIYDLPKATADQWCRLFVSLPIIDNKIRLRSGKTVTLTPAKRDQLLREPSRPQHPVGGKGTRPTLEDDTPAPKVAKKKTAKKKSTRKKTSTRKKSASKKAGKRSKKKK